MAKQYWLLKSEPDVYSIDHLARDRRSGWEGVRNFQARNLLRSMKAGDLGFFYHSSATPPGIAGIVRIAREAYPDPTQFDRKSEYHDPGSDPKDPRWSTIDVEFVSKLPELLSLETLRAMPEIAGMALLKRGQRLSVQPVSASEWTAICRRAGVGPA